jgi:tetratricopeptide (TPR) repeat protein
MEQQAWDIRHLLNNYRPLFTAVLLAVLVYLALGGVGENDFILFDDAGFITDNPEVLRGLDWESIQWAFTTTLSGNWLPLTWLSHILDVQLFGVHPAGHHLVSLAIHLASVLVLFETLYRFTGLLRAAALAALLFGIHPLRVESVAWAAERKDVLSCLLGLLAIRAYLSYGRCRTPARYGIVFVLLLSGLMSKSMLVTWPFVFLLLDFWPLERYSWQHKSDGISSGIWLEKIPFFVLSIIFSVIAFLAQSHTGAVVSLQANPVLLRFENATVSYVLYLWKMVYPANLALLYPSRKEISVIFFLFCLGFLCLVSLFAVRQWSKRPWLIFGWLWYLGILIPVIGLVQIGNQSMADRYTYIPSIGICIIAGWCFENLLRQGRGLKVLAVSMVVVVCGFMLAMTWRQVGYWKNSLTIFGHTLAVTGDNPPIHINYIHALKQAGEFKEAKKQCEQLLDKHPGYPEVKLLLGEISQQTGNLDQAIEYWLDALRDKPSSPAFLLYRLGSVYIQKEDYLSAQKYSMQAIEADPACISGYVNLGIILKKQGKPAQAIAMWEKSLAQNNNDVPTLKSIAWTLATAKDLTVRNPSKALFYAQHVAAITRDRSPEVLDILAAAYAAAGQYEKAITLAQKAARLARDKKKDDLDAAIQERIALYQQHKPYQEQDIGT